MFAPRLAWIGFAALFGLASLPADADEAPGARMRSEARALIASVDAPKRSRLVLPLADGQRIEWHYTPRSWPGLSLADFDPAQRDAVHRTANPAEVRKGAKQDLRALGAEEDEARKLLGMLDPSQRRAAILDARTYGDIVTGAGSGERGRQHYYRVQGPKFLIGHDASQNDGNHVHTVWRDYQGDFGRDLLREHHALARGTRHRH